MDSAYLPYPISHHSLPSYTVIPTTLTLLRTHFLLHLCVFTLTAPSVIHVNTDCTLFIHSSIVLGSNSEKRLWIYYKIKLIQFAKDLKVGYKRKIDMSGMRTRFLAWPPGRMDLPKWGGGSEGSGTWNYELVFGQSEFEKSINYLLEYQ